MLVPAERCSGVSPVLTREKRKGKKEGTRLLFRDSFLEFVVPIVLELEIPGRIRA